MAGTWLAGTWIGIGSGSSGTCNHWVVIFTGGGSDVAGVSAALGASAALGGSVGDGGSEVSGVVVAAGGCV
ncbi:hypothetical protein AO501_29225, partial [Mycobacterium gordonae]